MPWRIVVDVDSQEVFRYATTFPEQFTDQYPLDVYTHLYVENLVDPDSVRPAKADDGSVTLVPNLEWHWTALRTERNRLLQQSDWVALSDAHLSQDKKDAWFAYRQALRDLPDEVTDPTQVDWPLDPTVVVQAPVTGSRLSSLLTHADVEPVVPVVEVTGAEPVQQVTEAEPVQEVAAVEPVQQVTAVEPVVESPVVTEA